MDLTTYMAWSAIIALMDSMALMTFIAFIILMDVMAFIAFMDLIDVIALMAWMAKNEYCTVSNVMLLYLVEVGLV